MGGLLGEGGLSLGRLSVEIVKAGMIEVRAGRGVRLVGRMFARACASEAERQAELGKR
jgi:hypothetical protein